jgi:poly-gamma-glutamate capsule biosynthesis protein CapA/YwtB (metallophosphatase superfamily)
MTSRKPARLSRPKQAALLGFMLAVGCASCGGSNDGKRNDNSGRAEIAGQVLSLDGRPVVGARIVGNRRQTTTDGRGRFRLTGAYEAQWITAKHADYISRTRAASPGSPVLLRLTPDDGKTISVQFGGDVMFGRRFYTDGLLTKTSRVSEHLALLEHVNPVLENADITVVNLETPLISMPYFTYPHRPARFHQTKQYVFASHTSSARALKDAGIDVAGLGNNHLYDALEPGVMHTIQALHRAGFKEGRGHFGAGASDAEAWRPAVVRRRRQSIAILGCTTIYGEEHHVTYVVEGAGKGGSAACDETQIRARVAALRRRHYTVVVMVHGGFEYVPRPSRNVRRLTEVARAAGATLVIDGHPHVVGGFSWNGRSLAAWTMGNLLFDQTVWPTFQSYLLTVHLRRGRVIRAYTEPLLIDDYIPQGVTGDLADSVAREAAGVERGPFVLEDGSMEVDIGGVAKHRQSRASLRGSRRGTIFRIDRGTRLSGLSPPDKTQPGRDLLWVGGFEDEDVDAQADPDALWTLSESAVLAPSFACTGKSGVRIQRVPSNQSAAVLTPSHRVLVDQGRELSLVGMVRPSALARPTVDLSIYRRTRGPSDQQKRLRIPQHRRRAWLPFRLDLTVPRGVVAVAPYLRLPRSSKGAVTAEFDDVRLIQWERRGALPTSRHRYVRVYGNVEAHLNHDYLPGAAAWAQVGVSRVLGGGPRLSGVVCAHLSGSGRALPARPSAE